LYSINTLYVYISSDKTKKYVEEGGIIMSGISKWVLKWAKIIILISCLLAVLFEIFFSGDYSIVIKKNKTNSKTITQLSDGRNILDRDKDKLRLYGINIASIKNLTS